MSLEANPRCYTVAGPAGPQHWLDLSGDPARAKAEREAIPTAILRRDAALATNRRRERTVAWPMYIVLDVGAVLAWWLTADRAGGILGLAGFIALATILATLATVAWFKAGLPPALEAVPSSTGVTTRGLIIGDDIWRHAPEQATRDQLLRWVQADEGERAARNWLADVYHWQDRPGDFGQQSSPHDPFFRADSTSVPRAEDEYRAAYAQYAALAAALRFQPRDAAPIRASDPSD